MEKENYTTSKNFPNPIRKEVEKEEIFPFKLG
jgi:hypothetical protein